jgi:hypothetical protein
MIVPMWFIVPAVIICTTSLIVLGLVSIGAW